MRARDAVLIDLVDLYKGWHTAEPGKGYNTKAAEWQAKLDEVHAAIESAAAESEQ